MSDDPSANAPPMNVAIEDMLAHAPDDESRILVLDAWLLLGVEYRARESGRLATVDRLMVLRHFVETAEPRNPWPE